MKRSYFLQVAGIAGLTMPFLGCISLRGPEPVNKKFTPVAPVSVNTWNFQAAGARSGEILAQGGTALDAAQQGVMVEERNIQNTTVGNGGTPDRDGFVTLDASIMGPDGNCGSVAFLHGIENPVAVARKVMEDTPHTFLVGEGAYNFAIQKGFKPLDLLSEESKRKWEDWLIEKEYKPIINIENHDTIGMLCLDEFGDMAGACTTSGLAYKMRGRVGDSPIIGSGLFIDNEIGGAVATGLGEEIMKNVSSFLVVELMRQGNTPQQACEIAIKRIIKRNPDYKDFQVALLAMNKQGDVGSYCIHPGFTYVKTTNMKSENIPGNSFL